MLEKKWLPAAVIIAALCIAYAPLVTNQGLVVTDDTFTSDITNGEWPLRIEIGRMVRQGEWPLWSRTLYGGYPLLPASPAAEPLTLLLFSSLGPVAALNAYILIVLAMAGLGTAVLARAMGCSLAGSAIAGIGFAFSGYMVCQLKHLGIISCISWTPWALWALLRAFENEAEPLRPKLKWLGLFSLTTGLQWLAAFPQSSYIATLLYVAFGFALILRRHGKVRNTLAFGLSGVLGVLIGAVQLIAIYQHTKLSTRSEGVSVEWATQFNYWLPNLWTFVWPYKNGDIGNHTYEGHGIFWEDYSYVGLITFTLALATLAAVRSTWVRFWWLTALVAMLLVLGNNTPFFPAAFHVLPGLNFFRFPTRFLFVVHLGLSLLAAVSLTRFEGWLRKRKIELIEKTNPAWKDLSDEWFKSERDSIL